MGAFQSLEVWVWIKKDGVLWSFGIPWHPSLCQYQFWMLEDREGGSIRHRFQGTVVLGEGADVGTPG